MVIILFTVLSIRAALYVVVVFYTLKISITCEHTNIRVRVKSFIYEITGIQHFLGTVYSAINRFYRICSTCRRSLISPTAAATARALTISLVAYSPLG